MSPVSEIPIPPLEMEHVKLSSEEASSKSDLSSSEPSGEDSSPEKQNVVVVVKEEEKNRKEHMLPVDDGAEKKKKNYNAEEENQDDDEEEDPFSGIDYDCVLSDEEELRIKNSKRMWTGEDDSDEEDLSFKRQHVEFNQENVLRLLEEHAKEKGINIDDSAIPKTKIPMRKYRPRRERI